MPERDKTLTTTASKAGIQGKVIVEFFVNIVWSSIILFSADKNENFAHDEALLLK